MYQRAAVVIGRTRLTISDPPVSSSIQLNDFNEAMRAHSDLRAIFAEPYAACLQWVLMTLLGLMEERQDSQRIAFVHEFNDHRKSATGAFAYVKHHMNSARRIMSLTFGSKADYVPLQAADVLAYEANHRLRDVAAGSKRRSWKALNPEMKCLTVGYFDKKNMGELIALLSAFRDEVILSGKLPPRFWEKRSS